MSFTPSAGTILLAIVLLLAFLLVLAVIAYSISKIFSRKEGEGIGCLPGLILSAILTGLALLSFVVFTFVMVTAVISSNVESFSLWVEESPQERLGVQSREPAEAYHERAEREYDRGRRLVHLVVAVRGELLGDTRLKLTSIVEDMTDGEVHVDEGTARDAAGRELTVLDFVVAVSEHDIAELERELERRIRGFDLPGGPVIEFRGVQRDL